MQWKVVFNANLTGWRNLGEAMEYASIAGYSYLTLNGKVYRTNGEPIDLLENELI